MNQLKTSIIVAILLLNGCSAFPEYGKGGMAEHHIELLDPFYTDEPLGKEHGLSFEFELVRQQLAVLVREGAYVGFPATVMETKDFEARMAREIYGEMLVNATNEVIVLLHLLPLLELKLEGSVE